MDYDYQSEIELDDVTLRFYGDEPCVVSGQATKMLRNLQYMKEDQAKRFREKSKKHAPPRP
jgi:hypothetical protein